MITTASATATTTLDRTVSFMLWVAVCDECGREAPSMGERPADAADFAAADGWTVVVIANRLETNTLCPWCAQAVAACMSRHPAGRGRL